MIGSATAMELNNTESNPEFLRTILKGKDTLKLIFGAYIMLNILALLSSLPNLIKKIITIFCIINFIIVMHKTNGNMTIKRPRGPIRQGWVELSRVETGSLFQSHINIAPGPIRQNKEKVNMKQYIGKQKDNIQTQERAKCIQAYLSNTSRTSTDRKNHFNLSSMSQTEEKLLVRINTLMTGQIILVMLLAIISSKIYRLLLAQTVIIMLILQTPLLTEPI